MHTIAHTHTSSLARAIVALGIAVALGVFLYGFFLLEAVGNTAQRTAYEREVRALTSKVSALEQAYLSKTREITLVRAHELGLVTPTEATTVFAKTDIHTLSFNH